jgi:DNA polymerase III gamma/tau subunit
MPLQPYKIYIIDEVHMLHPRPSTLLKTLEKPPALCSFMFTFLNRTRYVTIRPTFDLRRIGSQRAGHLAPSVAGRGGVGARPELIARNPVACGT